MNSNLLQNSEYKHWLKDLKQKVLQSQLKAVVQVNSTLLEFYWELGEEIVLRQTQARWGDGFLKQLSQGLMAEFPEMKGFSKRNLEQIRKWYKFWSSASEIAQQPVSQLCQVLWGYNIVIVRKAKNIEELENELGGER